MRPRARSMPARLQHVLLAGVGLERQYAALDRRLIAPRIALDHDERHALLPELPGHDAADPAVPADDEVVLDRIDHAYSPALPEMIGQPALDHEGGELREGVERRADAADHQAHREDLARPRKLVNLPEADRRHRRDGHVERVPRVSSLRRRCSRSCRRQTPTPAARRRRACLGRRDSGPRSSASINTAGMSFYLMHVSLKSEVSRLTRLSAASCQLSAICTCSGALNICKSEVSDQT